MFSSLQNEQKSEYNEFSERYRAFHINNEELANKLIAIAETYKASTNQSGKKCANDVISFCKNNHSQANFLERIIVSILLRKEKEAPAILKGLDKSKSAFSLQDNKEFEKKLMSGIFEYLRDNREKLVAGRSKLHQEFLAALIAYFFKDRTKFGFFQKLSIGLYRTLAILQRSLHASEGVLLANLVKALQTAYRSAQTLNTESQDKILGSSEDLRDALYEVVKCNNDVLKEEFDKEMKKEKDLYLATVKNSAGYAAGGMHVLAFSEREATLKIYEKLSQRALGELTEFSGSLEIDTTVPRRESF